MRTSRKIPPGDAGDDSEQNANGRGESVGQAFAGADHGEGCEHEGIDDEERAAGRFMPAGDDESEQAHDRGIDEQPGAAQPDHRQISDEKGRAPWRPPETP